MRRLLVLFITCITSVLSAHTAPCPGQFGVAAEWLYMLPAYDQPYYVINSTTDSIPRGPRVANGQDWHSGYRVEAIYTFCDRPNNVRLRWSHFPTFSEEDQATGPNLYGVINSPHLMVFPREGTMSMRDTFDFYYLEFLFGQKLFTCGPFQMDVQAGLQSAYLDLRERLFLDDGNPMQSQTVKVHSQLWGIGPEVGYDFSYCIWNCITFTGRGHAALLVSERDASYRDFDPDPGYDVKNNKYWLVIPTTDLRFGLSYQTGLNFPWLGRFCGCINIDLEIGYEVITYYKSLDRIKFYDNVEIGLSADQLMDFSLHGPYVHLGLTF